MAGSPTKRGEEDVTMAQTERTPLLPSKRQDLVEDVYDDYHEASVPSAVFNLSTTIVGAGIMALPATMKVMGLPLGIVTIIVMGILSENSIQIMLRYSRPSGARSYGGLMADAFGQFGRVLVQLCIIINNVGILIVYMIIIGDVLSGSTSDAGKHYTGVLEEWAGGPTWWNDRTFVLFLIAVVVLLPLISFRHVDSLKWTSALSVALAVVFVVIIAGVTVWKLFAGEISWPRLAPDVHDQASFWKLFTVIPVMVTAYICHHNVHPIANELAGTADSSDNKMQHVVRWSMFLCGTIYLFTATFGYLLFGEGTSDDILSNFDTDLGVPFSNVICVIVRISYAVHLMLVFPLLNFSLRLNLDAILFPRATPLAHDTIRFSIITGFLICCVFFGAAIVPNIWIAFQFTGATATVCLGFIFPALVLLKDKPLLATRRDKCEAIIMVILAILSSVVAVTTDVFNLLEPEKQAELAMESLHLSIALPSLARKPLPFTPLSFDGYSQPIRFKESNRLESLRGRVVSRKGLVRARQGGGGEEEDGRKKFVFPNVEGKSEQERRRPLWKRGLGFVGSKLGFGEEWEVDPGGERELEELDSFLEGRGAEFRWKDVLEPSVENILALVLTGLFLYAAVLIGWQLLLVAAAITLSALKYAVIAAVLLGVLIFFL